MLTDRLVVFLPNGAGDAGFCSEVARRTAERGLTPLRTTPYVLAMRPLREIDHAQSIDGTKFVADISPGAAESDVARDWRSVRTAAEAEEFATGKFQVFNLIQYGAGAVSILGDPLGIKPLFTIELETGLLACSSLRDLEACCPGALNLIDELGLLEIFLFDSPFGDRTLHKRVRRPRSGTRICWNAGIPARTVRDRRIAPPSVDPSIGGDVAIVQIMRAYRETIERFFAGEPNPALLPLTGGFDSRLIACVLSGMPIETCTVTLGLHRHHEAQVARRVAAVLGIPHRIKSPSLTHAEKLARSLARFEGQIGMGTAFIADLLDQAPLGAPMFHGFIGDALSGAHLYWAAAEHCGSLDETAQAVVRTFTKELAPDFPRLLGLNVSLDDLTASIRGEFVENVWPYQALMLWDLENRQRRDIGSVLIYAGERYRVCAPNYSVPVIQAWLQLPRGLLEGRALLRRIFAARYPQVACLPHAEEDAPPFPRNWHALTYVGRFVLLKTIARVRMKFGMAAESDRLSSWSALLGTSTPQREFEEERLLELTPEIDRRFGFAFPPLSADLRQRLASSNWRRDKLLRRAFVLAEYAASLGR